MKKPTSKGKKKENKEAKHLLKQESELSEKKGIGTFLFAQG